MPIYEYKCKSCSKVFELFVKGSKDMSDIKCPQCNSKSVYKIMSSYSAFCAQSKESGFSDSGTSYPLCGCGGSSCGV